MSRKTQPADSNKNQRIQVFARCRPLTSQEKQSPFVAVEVKPDKKTILIKDKSTKEFLFDKVFPPETQQIEVYKSVVEPLIKEVLMGYNCTVFAYGQTGTGKTFTMEGEHSNSNCSWSEDPHAGIIPRSLHQLFEELYKEDNVEFSVRVSFLELYNEELFDLLSATDFPSNMSNKLRLFEDPIRKGSVLVKDLEEIIVNNKDEVLSILKKGTERRQKAATHINDQSSRSHAVFSVTVHIKENTIDGEELLKTGKLNLVDLAGSENVRRSGAKNQRLIEAGNINTSLLTLGRVITALNEKQPHIPYRESKLTRLLQDSLGGRTKTSIIATISPSPINLDETISTLEYATKAKSITIEPLINQKMTKRALMREYTEEIAKLKKELNATRNQDGYFVDAANYENQINELESTKIKNKDLIEKIQDLEEIKNKYEKEIFSTKEKNELLIKQLNQATDLCYKTTTELTNKTATLEHNLEQSKKILQVAYEANSDNEKLHDKIERKTTVEKTNEEKHIIFRNQQKQNLLEISDLVSHIQTAHHNHDDRIKADLNICGKKYDQCKKILNSCLNKEDQLVSKLQDFQSSLNCNTQSQIDNVNSIIKDTCGQKKKIIESMENSALNFDSVFIKLSEEIKNTCGWINHKNKDQIAQCKNYKNSSSNRMAIKSDLHQSLNSACSVEATKKEEILKVIKDMKHRNLSNTQEVLNLKKESALRYHGIRVSCQGLIEKVEENKQLQDRQYDSLLQKWKAEEKEISGLEKKVEELTGSHLINELCNSLKTEDEKSFEDLSNLDVAAALDIANELPSKETDLITSWDSVDSKLKSLLNKFKKDVEDTYKISVLQLKRHDSLLSESLHNQQNKIKEILDHEEDLIKDEKQLTEIIERLPDVKDQIEAKIHHFKEQLNQFAQSSKDRLSEANLDLEKFITQDLVKDLPTGTTPLRTSCYSQSLAELGTSLLCDSTQTALDCITEDPLVFNLEERTQSISMESLNSLALPDSISGCDSDSNASETSQSEISHEARNKENFLNIKKHSKLPKRQKFRNPLSSNNRDPSAQN